ncbi:MAG: sigma factor-like helix-turn-helix DNA-binding protein [Pseudonocardiaceae bacterium]
MDLLRRYSNRPDLLGPLVSILRRVTDPAEDGHETVTTIEGRTASPDYVREKLTEQQMTELIAAYRSGTTARELAERYGVHVSTVKKRLRRCGTRRTADPLRLRFAFGHQAS